MSDSYAQHLPSHQPHEARLRAGDSDREAVAEVLREHHLAGRLETDEFQERLDRCYAAKTYAELDVLVADLPARERRRRVRHAWRSPLIVLLPVLIAAIVLTHGHLLWVLVPLFLFSRPLLWRYGRPGWGVAGAGGHHGSSPDSY